MGVNLECLLSPMGWTDVTAVRHQVCMDNGGFNAVIREREDWLSG